MSLCCLLIIVVLYKQNDDIESLEVSASEYTESLVGDTTDDTSEIEYETELFQLPTSSITITGNSKEVMKTTFYQSTRDTVDMVVDVLFKWGFNSHFTSQQGGGFGVSYVKTWARRVGKFLNYSYYEVYSEILTEYSVTDWVIELIESQYINVFSKYVVHLSTVEDLAPNTVLADLNNIKQFLMLVKTAILN